MRKKKAGGIPSRQKRVEGYHSAYVHHANTIELMHQEKGVGDG